MLKYFDFCENIWWEIWIVLTSSFHSDVEVFCFSKAEKVCFDFLTLFYFTLILHYHPSNTVFMYLPVIVTVPLAIWKYAEMKENENISSFLWVVLITSQHNVCTITDVLDGFFFSHFTKVPFCCKSNFQNGTFSHRQGHLFTIRTDVLTKSVKSHSAAMTINFPLPGHGCPFSPQFIDPHCTTFPCTGISYLASLLGK